VRRFVLRKLFFSEYGGSNPVRKRSRHLPGCTVSYAIRPNVHVFRIWNLTESVTYVVERLIVSFPSSVTRLPPSPLAELEFRSVRNMALLYFY